MANKEKISKVIIPAAGLGTRLLPLTKEMPKEMLPIFLEDTHGRILVKPMLQVIFERLYSAGIREFCFIVGKGKRAIEDHFLVENRFLEELEKKNESIATILKKLYDQIENSSIVMINQPEARGFGDAVYRGKPFIGNETFLVHAGDDLIISEDNDHVERLVNVYKKHDADIVFFVEEIDNPSQYGVIEGDEIEENVFHVFNIVEKPKIPPSNLAIIAIYIFKPVIFSALEQVKPDNKGELQLTDGIIEILRNKGKIMAIKLKANEKRIDIGTPEKYQHILQKTFKEIKERTNN